MEKSNCSRCNGTGMCGPWGDSDRDADDLTKCNECTKYSPTDTRMYTADEVQELRARISNQRRELRRLNRQLLYFTEQAKVAFWKARVEAYKQGIR